MMNNEAKKAKSRFSCPLYSVFCILLTLCLLSSVICLLVYGAETLRCAVCGKVISGKYFESKGKAYCSEKCLLESKPACVVCGKKTLKGGKKYKGKYVCSEECLLKLLPKCAACGKPVRGGKGLRSGEKYFCSQECFEKSLPVCCLCGKRIQNIIKMEDRTYCETCAAGEKCIQCGFPAGGGKLPDNRPMCSQCRNKGIINSADARRFYSEIQTLLSREFEIETDNSIKFHLVDFNELSKLTKRKEMKENGLYVKSTIVTEKNVSFFGVKVMEGLSRSEDVKKHIYILTWLDKPHFRLVAAHELMHDWTDTNFPEIKDQRLIEGLSEFAAYLAMKHFKYEKTAALMEKNKDPVYGDGFRLVKAADKGGGMEDIKKWLETGAYKKDLAELGPLEK